jgi:signal transduction histidine kinase
MGRFQTLNVAIVGGGPGCKAIMDMIFAKKLTQLRMRLIGVACTNPEAVGYRYAQENDVYTTRDYRELYKLQNLDMIVELTGRDRVAKEILRSKPDHVRFMDHVAARLFWDIFEIEKERIEERNRVEERLLTYQEKLRSLASELSLTEERERQRISAEVHENIGQSLAYAKVRLGTVRESVASQDVGQAMDEAMDVVDETIQEARSLASQVSPPVLHQLGLAPAIESLIKEIEKQQGVAADVKDDGEPKPVSNEVRALLFQSVRDLLTNIFDHAKARVAKVCIVRSGDEIRIDVTDHDVEFSHAEIEISADEIDRYSLFSIRERLSPIGGRIELAPEPSQGTKVTLVGPLIS